MRAIAPFTPVLGLLVLSVSVSVSAVGAAGCTADAPAPQRVIKQGNVGAPAPGQADQNGEHGSSAPAGPTTVPDPGTSVGTDTWADGKNIAANITIAQGATITIAPGATVTVAAGVAITIQGTLKVAATAAKHSSLTGAEWAGIVVAPGGALTTDGLDFTGAQAAIWTQAANADATVTNSVIKADTPFKMETGSKLAISSSQITATAGSAIAGTFTASKIDYDKTTAPGLTLNDAAGTMTISDSTLRGEGGGDYVISVSGHAVKVEYSTISGSHCALHFDSVDQYTVDHVSFNLNTYGGMLYGSGAGPNTISSSNLDGIYEMTGTNGPLTLDKNFAATTATFTGTPKATAPAAARLADAQPNAEPAQ